MIITSNNKITHIEHSPPGCGFSSCQNHQEPKTNGLTILRITLVTLGVIAIVVGALVARDLMQINSFGTTAGYGVILCGVVCLLAAVIRCAKKASNSHIDQDQNASQFILNKLDSTRLDPSKPENACKILNIPENRLRDLSFIETQHTRLIEELTKRQSQLTPALSNSIEALIEDAHRAFDTLKKENEKQRTSRVIKAASI